MKIPKQISDKKIINFFRKKKLEKIIFNSKKIDKHALKLISKKPYNPDLTDLYYLYQFIFNNKRTTVLEFGSGWSSLVISLALTDLKKKYNTSYLRRGNPFELFIVENEKKYLNITKKRIETYRKKDLINIKINYLLTKAKMTNYHGNISSEYEKLPMCNPDFIYLDGPDQFKIQGKINNLNFGHLDFVPMSCDILKIENFLLPGTMILIDGRKSNARFLKNCFKRNWQYIENVFEDQTVFYLDEKPLGKINQNLLNFYKKK